jgi:hypothetical protein
MDKQVVFFLILSVFFIYNGVVKFDPILQMAGILMIVFLIYGMFFHKEDPNLSRLKYESKFGLILIFGNIDLIFGLLLVLEGIHSIVPHVFLSIAAVFVLLKALFFVFGGDIASIIDTIVSLLIIVDAPVLSELKIVVAIYFIQKGLLTCFS